MEIIDIDNNITTETQYVTTVDINNMDPCTFKNKTNPVSNKKCKETFNNLEENINMNYNFSLPDDPIVQAFFASFGIFGIYMFYKILSKNKIIPEL